MKTPLTPKTPVHSISRALLAIHHVHKAFGPPGEYGYHTPQGDALWELYEANNELGEFFEAAKTRGLTPSFDQAAAYLEKVQDLRSAIAMLRDDEFDLSHLEKAKADLEMLIKNFETFPR